MRYTQLRAFHQVALSGGFSRAAAALGLTQPSVSDQVRRLEQAHDVLLFRREARAVRLTPEGEELLRLTREFFEVEQRIGDYLDRSRAAVTGTLRIVADSAMHVTQAVGAFRTAHPRAFVSIHTGNTEEVLRRLRKYEAEFGVVGNMPAAPDLDAVDLGWTPIVAVARRGYFPDPDHALEFAELAEHPLVFRETGSRTRAALEAEAAQVGVTLTPAVEVEGREAMREVVASGAGIGFVSIAEFGNDERLCAVPLTGTQMGMRESLVVLSARRDVPVIRAFLRKVQQLSEKPIQR